MSFRLAGKREWLNPAATVCEIHDHRLQAISSFRLHQLKNLNAVIRWVGKQYARGDRESFRSLLGTPRSQY